MRYYLLRGDEIIQAIDTKTPAFVYLPVLETENQMSLVNEEHLERLMLNQSLTPEAALAAIGVVDTREDQIKPVDDIFKSVVSVKPGEKLPPKVP